MHSLVLTRELINQGFSPDEIARMARKGDLQRTRHVAYARGTEAADDREAHRRLVEATVRQVSPEAVVSHLSAAVPHGLPIWNDGLARVHLTRNRRTGAKVGTVVQLHSGVLDESEVTEVDGLRVTTLARTVVDIGRSLSFLRSVPIGDAALAAGLGRDQLDLAVGRVAGRTGAGAARRMADFCDGRSESVGDSTSRVVLFLAGVPTPQLQHDVVNPAGKLVGRTDFYWEEERTVGEYDGKITYGRLLQPGQTASDVVYAEKLREDQIRDLELQVVRWTWDDLTRPRTLVERVDREGRVGAEAVGRG